MSGSIHITEGALASLIGLTAHEIPGVVGMAPVNLREGIQRVLGRAQSRDGVVIHGEKGRAARKALLAITPPTCTW